MLYIVGTPIGNLGDISERACDVLQSVDFIAAEDTRNTVKLLNHLGIKKPLISYHEHNKAEMGRRIADRLLSGESCALVTDAGMPAISDPGEDLVALCIEENIEYTAVPGPTAFATALCLSGLPCSSFAFEGFLPSSEKERRKRLASLSQDSRTLIFYEAPHRLCAFLKTLSETFGEREIALCRELTKLHEEILRLTPEKALALYEEKEPRGEYVIVVKGYEAEKAEPTDAEILKLVTEKVKSGKKASDAAKETASELGVSKNRAYKLYLSEKE